MLNSLGPVPCLPPSGDVLTLRRELDNACVPVTIGHVDGSVGSEGEIRRAVEMLVIFAGLAFDSQRQQPFALIVELDDLVITVVGNPNVAVRVDTQSVLVAEHAAPPGADILSLGVENDQRIGDLATVENVDQSGGVGGDRRHSSEMPAPRAWCWAPCRIES